MIETENLTKVFRSRGDGSRDVTAVNGVSLRIPEGEIFGLVGTNGAGKSTLLRLAAGVLRPESGSVTLDGEGVYDNPEAKRKLFFIPSDPWYFSDSCGDDMAQYYRRVYEGFDRNRFLKLMKDFGLDPQRRIADFSRGMKRQLSILLGICAGTKYLLLDETFDGLDPVMRQAVKTLFAEEMEDRGMTPVLSSHSLREIEDICDHIGILHRGGVLLSEDLAGLKEKIQKVQCVFASEEAASQAESLLDIVGKSVRGRLHTYTVRGTRESVEEIFRGIPTIFFEILPLTLEEIFISETEAAGYDIKKLILS